jgi:hypothetical protein
MYDKVQIIYLLNKWAKELNRQFSEETQMTNKHMKKGSAYLAIKKMQIKTPLRFHLTPVMRLSSRKQIRANAGKEDKGEREHHIPLVGM